MRDAQIVKLPAGVYPIPEYRGLRMVVGAGGTRSWSWRHRTREGKLKQVALGTWPKVTMREAIEAIEGLKAGNADPTVGDLIDAYVREHLRVRRKHPDRTVGMLEKHVYGLWRVKARTVGRTEAAALLAGLKDWPATAHMLRRELMAVWDHAGLESNPWGRLRTRPNPPRQRCLSERELVLWYSWLMGADISATVRDAVLLCLLTGCRSGELIGMEWEDIDLDAGTWMLAGARTKTGQGRTVQLNGWAVRILRDRLALMGGNSLWHIGRGIAVDARNTAVDTRNTPFSVTAYGLPTPTSAGRHVRNAGGPSRRTPVFPSRNGGSMAQPRLVNAMHRVAGTMPIAHATIHDLRRTCRSSLARLGCPEHVAELCLGHKPQGIVAVYNVHTYDGAQKQWLTVWCDYLEKLLLTS